jgi:hypothetical protein
MDVPALASSYGKPPNITIPTKVATDPQLVGLVRTI